MRLCRPARSCAGGRVPRRLVSTSTVVGGGAADEVFAGDEVDAGLTADRGVDLREERCRNLHVTDAAHVDGGEESGDVAEDAATERARIAIGAGGGRVAGRGIRRCSCACAIRLGRKRMVGDSLKLARKGFKTRAQISGEVMTKGRKGLSLLSCFRRGLRVRRRLAPMITLYFAEGVLTEMTGTVSIVSYLLSVLREERATTHLLRTENG